MKKVIWLSLFICLAIEEIGIAQSFKITDYRPDSLTTWQWKPNLTSSGVIDNVSNENLYYWNYQPEYTENKRENPTKMNISRFSIQPGLTFNFKKISVKNEIYASMASAYRINRSSSVTDSITKMIIVNPKKNVYNRQWGLCPTFTGTLSWTEYYKSKLGIGINIDLRADRTQINSKKIFKNFSETTGLENKTITNEKYTLPCFSIVLSPELSYGRIYDGEYAAKAEELIAELKRNGRLQRDLNKQEFLHLSKLILIQRERYHYDSRIRNIEAMQTIIDYLKSISAILPDDSRAHLILHDIYLFSTVYPRLFGVKYFIRPKIGTSQYTMNISDLYKKFQYTAHLDNDLDIVEDSLISYSSDSKTRSTSQYFHNFSELSAGAFYTKIYTWHFWYNIEGKLSYGEYINNSKKKHNYYYQIADTLDTLSFKSRSKDKKYSTSLDVLSRFYYQWNSRSIASLAVLMSWYSRNTYPSLTNKDIVWKYREAGFIFEIIPRITYYLSPKLILDTYFNNHLERSGRGTSQKTEFDRHKMINRRWYDTGIFNFSLTYYL